MTYLVLGSNSFAGSTFVDEMLKHGESVIGMSRSNPPHEVLRPYSSSIRHQNYIFYAWDLNRHWNEVKAMMLKHKPRYVIDFASQSMVAESWLYPEQWYTTNIVAKVKLHDFLRQCDFLDRYVRISTPEVFGHVDGMITETLSFNPTTPYAVSQAAIDMSLNVFYKQYEFPVLFTRYANFYGPYQQFYRIVPKAIIYGLLQKKLPLHGGGLSKRAFIYGTDVAEAIQLTIEKGQIGRVYHFSENQCFSIMEVVEKIAHKLKMNSEDLVSMAPERPGKDAQYFMSTQRVETELGWKPRISFEQGLDNTVDWVQKNIQTIKGLSLEYSHKA